MEKKIEELKARHQQLEKQLQDLSVSGEQNKIQKVAKEYDEIKQVLELWQKLVKVSDDLGQAEATFKDAEEDELKKIAEEEISDLNIKQQELKDSLDLYFNPQDPMDKKDIIVEIRAGVGGDEAALFAADLFRIYSLFAERKGWKTILLNSSRTPIGGFKEIVFEITGTAVYSNLKYEMGVHRVQRIPDTEKSGRVHTSTVTVAVLPEAEETDLEIKPEDIRVDVYHASGHGGQSVNTTDSAVRITYLPTDTVVTCQDEKSQIKNRDKAMKVLRSRLLAEKESKERKERSEQRSLQIGWGTRSEKIRTYNYPQDRVTDHRIKQSWHGIDKILDGELEPIITAFKQEEKKE
ncbi:peptide chain release factor 1 [Patescibacteria group bacterium]|nr:peptide chain release factor 1 [Patescibacteria group bacterium]